MKIKSEILPTFAEYIEENGARINHCIRMCANPEKAFSNREKPQKQKEPFNVDAMDYIALNPDHPREIHRGRSSMRIRFSFVPMSGKLHEVQANFSAKEGENETSIIFKKVVG